jgi:hypothetical protein
VTATAAARIARVHSQLRVVVFAISPAQCRCGDDRRTVGKTLIRGILEPRGRPRVALTADGVEPMPRARRIVSRRSGPLAAAAFLGAALWAAGCGGGHAAGPGSAGGAGTSAGGGGAGGAAGEAACAGPADPRVVVAPQRTVALTGQEVTSSIGLLFDPTAAALVAAGLVFSETDLVFPPAVTDQYWAYDEKPTRLAAAAGQVAGYVADRFATLSGCAAPATDDCARPYLDALAEKAYRRPLSPDEQDALHALYAGLRAGAVDGGADADADAGAPSVEQAAAGVVRAILTATPFLYRSEMGDPNAPPSTSPPGIPLTEYELASALSFFLGDVPPDQALLDAARAGTLSRDLAAHVDRLLATPASRAWLTTVMLVYFGLNKIPDLVSVVDPTVYPQVSDELVADMQEEAQRFLDHTLWNLDLTALVSSRTTFLNSTLATTTYHVPVPPGADETTFVETTLPAGERAGLLTNAGFIALRTTADSDASSFTVIHRGEMVMNRMLCRTTEPETEDLLPAIEATVRLYPTQTLEQQTATRLGMPVCASCHQHFDPYGVLLDAYDGLGGYRLVDQNGPIDTRTTLPPELGGAAISRMVDLGPVLAASPAFTDCMASSLLSYALPNVYDEAIFRPSRPGETPVVAGCATAAVTGPLATGGAATFTDLVRAVALSKTFGLRRAP